MRSCVGLLDECHWISLVLFIGWRVENVVIVFHCPQTIASSHVFLSYFIHLYGVASFTMLR